MGGNSVWLWLCLCLCSWWVHGCVHRSTCWHTFLFCVLWEAFQIWYFLAIGCLGFFQTLLFKAILHSPNVSLWLVLAKSAIFFLLVCIHTEIWAFCIHMSTCDSIIHHGKKVKTEWSFSFEVLCLEIHLFPAAVIENCLPFFTIICIPHYVVFN